MIPLGRRLVVIPLLWLAGAILAGGALLALYVLVVWLRLPAVGGLGDAGDPGATSFMAEDGCAEHARSYRPLSEIDPRLGCAFVWSEDWRFFRHDGVDLPALKWAARENWRSGGFRFGASTIPMQLARNLYLTRSRTLSRKGKEIALARRLVARYSRTRLLELYLNATELAPCVYGVEAAAQHYFGHGAGRVDAAEATFLAVMLPRPATPPGRLRDDRTRLVGQQQKLLTRLYRAGLLGRAELRAARVEILAGWRDGWRGHRPAVERPAPQAFYDRYCGTLGPGEGPGAD